MSAKWVFIETVKLKGVPQNPSATQTQGRVAFFTKEKLGYI
jgi:hypothetical protein